MSAADRLGKARRVEAVQRRLRQRADHVLIQLERDEAAAVAERAAVLAVLNDECLSPVVVGFAVRRLKTIDAEIVRLAGAVAAQKAKALEEAMRLERAERSTSRVAAASRAEAERRALDETLEALIARCDASFPPA